MQAGGRDVRTAINADPVAAGSDAIECRLHLVEFSAFACVQGKFQFALGTELGAGVLGLSKMLG